MESPKVNGPKPNAAMVEAVHWSLKAESNRLTAEDRRAFVSWLKQSPENISELLRIAEINGKFAGRDLVDSGSNIVDLLSKLPTHPQSDDKPVDQAQHNQKSGVLLGLALSSTYLQHFRKDNRPAKLALGGLSLLILVASILGFPSALPAAGISVGFLAAVALKEAVLSYRISHGLFGSTASDAQVLLRFLIENSSTIDFDDRNGKQRPVFEPAARSAERPVPAGATTE